MRYLKNRHYTGNGHKLHVRQFPAIHYCFDLELSCILQAKLDVVDCSASANEFSSTALHADVRVCEIGKASIVSGGCAAWHRIRHVLQ